MAAASVLMSLSVVNRTEPLSRTIKSNFGVWVLYAGLLGLVTFTRQLPVERYQLFLALPVALAGFFVTERFRPGGWLRVVTIVSTIHVLLALSTGQFVLAFNGGATRLQGATSAVLLGFEAVLLIITMLFYWRRGVTKWIVFPVALVATIALIAAFSRAAFLSAMAAVALIYVFSSGRRKILRIFFGAIFIVFAAQYLAPALVSFLSAGRLDSLTGASGRYDIWSTALSQFDEWWRGFGFAANYNLGGPDQDIYLALRGLPLESSWLQALFMGGVIVLAVWIVAFVRTIATLVYRGASAHQGVVVAFAAPLIVAAVYSVGLSGVSFDFWWLLAMMSLVSLLETSKYPSANLALEGF